MKTINVYNYKYSQKRKKGGDIHHRYILITYCDGIAWKKGYPHTMLVGPKHGHVIGTKAQTYSWSLSITHTDGHNHRHINGHSIIIPTLYDGHNH